MKIMTKRATMGWLGKIARLDPQARSDDAFFFKHGQVFSRKPLELYEKYLLKSLLGNVYPFKVGECFTNAALLALEHDGLEYCEGMASGFWPVSHAWNVFHGRAIDVTWPLGWTCELAAYKPTMDPDKILERVEWNIRHCTYIGLKVPTERLRDILLDTKRHMPVARQYAANLV